MASKLKIRINHALLKTEKEDFEYGVEVNVNESRACTRFSQKPVWNETFVFDFSEWNSHSKITFVVGCYVNLVQTKQLVKSWTFSLIKPSFTLGAPYLFVLRNRDTTALSFALIVEKKDPPKSILKPWTKRKRKEKSESPELPFRCTTPKFVKPKAERGIIDSVFIVQPKLILNASNEIRGNSTFCFSAEVTQMFPKLSVSEIPSYIWLHCFPSGANLSTFQQQPEVFPFIEFNEDGERTYFCCLKIWLPIPKAVNREIKELLINNLCFQPICLCTFSYFPMFSFFKYYLSELYIHYFVKGFNIPLEHFLFRTIFNLPRPKKQMVPLSVFFSESSSTVASLPTEDRFIQLDFSISMFVRKLGLKNFIAIVNSLLCDQQVIITSRSSTILFRLTECLRILIRPLSPNISSPSKWLNDETMANYNIVTKHLQSIDENFDAYPQSVVVDIDNGKTLFPKESVPKLPQEAYDQLYNTLFEPFELLNMDSINFTIPLIDDNEMNEKIQLAFALLMASLLKDIEQNLVYVRRNPKPITVFNIPKFLSCNEDNKLFFTSFCQTQAFKKYLSMKNKNSLSLFNALLMFTPNSAGFDDLYRMIKKHCPQTNEFVEIRPFDGFQKSDLMPPFTNVPILGQDFKRNSAPTDICKTEKPTSFKELRSIFVKLTSVDKQTVQSAPTPVLIIESLCRSLLLVSRSSIEKLSAPSSETGLLSSIQCEQVLLTLQTPIGRSAFREMLISILKNKRKQEQSKYIYLPRSWHNLLCDLVHAFLECAESSQDYLCALSFPDIMRLFKNEDGTSLLARETRSRLWRNEHFWQMSFFYETHSQLKEKAKEENELVYNVLKKTVNMMSRIFVDILLIRKFAQSMCSFAQLSLKYTIEIENLVQSKPGGVKSEVGKSLQSEYFAVFHTRSSAQRSRLANLSVRASKFFASSTSLVESPILSTLALSTPFVSVEGMNLTTRKGKIIEERNCFATREADFKTGTHSYKTKKLGQISFTKESLFKSSSYFALQFEKDNLFCGGENSIDVYNTTTKTSAQITSAPNFVSALTTQNDVIFGGFIDGEIRMCDVKKMKKIQSFRLHKGAICSLIYDNNLLFSASLNGPVCVWDIRERNLIRSVKTEPNIFVTNMCRVNNLLFITGREKTVRVFDFAKNQQWALNGHRDWTKKVLPIIEDNKVTLLTSSFDGTVKLWDPYANQLLSSFPLHNGSVNDMYYDQRRGILFTAGADSTVKVLKLDNGKGKVITEFIGHKDEIAFLTPIAKERVCSAGADGSLCLWDVPTSYEKCGKTHPRQTLSGHSLRITALASHMNLMASASLEKGIHFWGFERIVR